MARAAKSHFATNRRGAAAVEYAIILPVLLLFVLGIMDVGRLLWTYATLVSATDAAARCYAIAASACTTPAQVQTYAVTQAGGLNISSSAFTASTQSCGAQVSATLVFAFVIPWMEAVPPFGKSNSMTLNATACYPQSASSS
jgi:Flp pilus assembly protein TadG